MHRSAASNFGSTFGNRCFSQWNSLESNTDSLRSNPITDFSLAITMFIEVLLLLSASLLLRAGGKQELFIMHVSRPGI
jgi:hypothetical protein